MTATRFFAMTAADVRDLGLLGATQDLARGTLTFHFTNRNEVWILAPDGYPTDGSLEVVRFGDTFYVAPAEHPPS